MGVEFGNLLGPVRQASWRAPAAPETPPSERRARLVGPDQSCSAPPWRRASRPPARSGSGTPAEEDYVSKGVHPAFISYHLYDRRRAKRWSMTACARPSPSRWRWARRSRCRSASARPGRARRSTGSTSAWSRSISAGIAPILSAELNVVQAEPARIDSARRQGRGLRVQGRLQRLGRLHPQGARRHASHRRSWRVACGLYPVSAQLVPEGRTRHGGGSVLARAADGLDDPQPGWAPTSRSASSAPTWTSCRSRTTGSTPS